jgi:tRNA-2-methylthio-N6-dimethylallyladenosine synthase
VKYHLITYGCQMNTADSEEMAQPLAGRGFTATARLSDADIVLMNTCTVREQAEHRADSNIGRLRKWKDADPRRILIVAGCAATRWGDSIQKKYPFIDAVSPATKIEQFPELIEAILKDRWDGQRETLLSVDPTHDSRTPAVWRPGLQTSETDKGNWFGDERTGYVTIMRGCNLNCSYCIVPQVRGREKYRPMPEILKETETKVTQGFKEIMLLGQTVNSYYYREPASSEQASEENLPDVPGSPLAARRSLVYDFADLLRAVNAIEGVEQIRFMSPHPRHMRDHVIGAMAECSKVSRHIHLPAQSGSDSVLERMKRLYTRAEYLDIVRKLRAAMPGLLMTTDIIVGYPGESAADFTATLELLEEVRFDGLFAFKYSPRPGTASAEFPDDIPGELKESRLQEVLARSRPG